MAFGTKNVVKLDPMAYSLMILGESKVGKTTLIKEVCEKLDPREGSYMFLEIGQERGADAIDGINYVNCPEWEMELDELTNSAGFFTVCEDVINKKTKEYPNLKVIVVDTYDQLITIAEDEAIRQWNKMCKKEGHPEKCSNSINAIYGGYGRGEKAALKLMRDVKAELKKVGVELWTIGHVKIKAVTDVLTGESYEVLTSDQQQNYFNAWKKDLHFLALACIDREIAREKTGKKNPKTDKDIMVGKVKSESRRIKFRDDSFCVDSGCRFASIVPEIPLDADAFIKAVTDAIMAEHSKSGRSLEEVKAEQDAIAKAEVERIAAAEAKKDVEAELNKAIEYITDYCLMARENADSDAIAGVMDICHQHGYDNPKVIDSLAVATKIVEMIDKTYV